MLETATKWHYYPSDLFLFAIYVTDSSAFTGYINGTPTSTEVPYDNDLFEGGLGEEDWHDKHFGRMLLWNYDKGNARKVLSCDTAANIIYTEALIDDWVDNDYIGMKCPTINSSPLFSLDMSTVVPADTSAIFISLRFIDWTNVDALLRVHPYQTYSGWKVQNAFLQVLGKEFCLTCILPVYNQRIGIAYQNTPDAEVYLNLIAYSIDVSITKPVTSRLVSPKGIRIP